MQNTHNIEAVRALHAALLDIVSAMNRPQRDDVLLREAGVRLDRALFPLLVGIRRFGPIGVVDLAERAGRDYTTVSRQVAKLESLGLVERRHAENDRRLREAVATPRGRAMTDSLDAARARIAGAVLSSWEPREVDELVRLMRRLADAMNGDLASEG